MNSNYNYINNYNYNYININNYNYNYNYITLYAYNYNYYYTYITIYTITPVMVYYSPRDWFSSIDSLMIIEWDFESNFKSKLLNGFLNVILEWFFLVFSSLNWMQ